MKQKGKKLTGDPVRVQNYTSKWMSVRLHPATFYRRFDQFQDGFKSVKGLYAEFDLGDFILIRFSEKDDVTTFHRLHHSYI